MADFIDGIGEILVEHAAVKQPRERIAHRLLAQRSDGALQCIGAVGDPLARLVFQPRDV